MTDIINEEENLNQTPEEIEDIAVVDNGTTYESQESAIIAKEEADKAKLWAQESERQANLASGSADTAAQARDDAIAAITDTNLIIVATDLQSTPSKIKQVAENISDVSDVANNISNVNAVADNETNINDVNANKTNIDAVAGNETNINTVAGDKANIDIVAGDKANIDAVAANKTNIDKVATDINRVKLVADDIASVHTVAVDISNVVDVAANKTNIDTVAGDSASINAVAADLENIDAAQGYAQSAAQSAQEALTIAQRNLGQILWCTTPQVDAGLHLLDGSLISSGAYSAFFDYIADLSVSNPELFTTEASWQSEATAKGICDKYVYDSVNGTIRLPKYGNNAFVKAPTITTASTVPVKGNGSIMKFQNAGSSPSRTNMTIGTSGDYNLLQGGNTAAGDSWYLNTDATKSGAIADTSSLLNITNYPMNAYYYIVLATSVKTEIEVDIDEVITDLNGKADKDLMNLTSTGKNIANWSSNVTNCITKIPQDIKVGLNNGGLYLKDGCKYCVPNGFEQDGVTPHFDFVTITGDTVPMAYGVGRTGCMAVWSTDHFEWSTLSSFYSGSTQPPSGSWWVWYDTTTNKIKHSNGSTVVDGVSFPICMITENAGTGYGSTVKSIDQVFNGFGYIGSTIFALPGVEGLAPNGRNADGTYNTTKVSVNSVLTRDITGTGYKEFTLSSLISWGTGGYFVDEDGYLYAKINHSKALNTVIFGSCNIITAGTFDRISFKTAFHALDYNDSSTISGWSMPSNRYVNLTLGTSGSTYIAPANGWFVINKSTSSSNQYVNIRNNKNGMIWENKPNASGSYASCFMPVKKGDEAVVYYSAAGTTNAFRFIYTEGEI